MTDREAMERLIGLWLRQPPTLEPREMFTRANLERIKRHPGEDFICAYPASRESFRVIQGGRA
jgi:hypothetical protein